MKQELHALAIRLCGKGRDTNAPSMRRRTFFLSLTGLCAMAAIARAREEELKKAMIIRSRCVGCGDCVRQCPVTAISLVNGKALVDQSICVGCRACQKTCSYGAPRL